MLMQTMEERPADTKIDRLEKRMDERFDYVDALFSHVDTRFQRLEFQATNKQLRDDFQNSHRELRADIQAMQRNMLFGFFSLAGLFLTYAGFQLS